ARRRLSFLAPPETPQEFFDPLRDWRSVGDESPGLGHIPVGCLILRDLLLKRFDGGDLLRNDESPTGRAPRRLLENRQRGAVRQSVVDEGGPKHPLLAPRVR